MIDKYRLEDLRRESGEKGELARWVIQLQVELDRERRKGVNSAELQERSKADSNSHPAHGPVSLDRLHQIRETLSKAAAQSDGGNLGYAMSDAVKAIDELLEVRKAEPAGYHVIKECGKVGCSVATLEEAEKTREFWNKKWTIKPYFYTAQPAPVVPDALPENDGEDGNDIDYLEPSQVYELGRVTGWNACRAAMLNGGKS